MTKYLDQAGLSHLWPKIRSKFPTKTSDLTNDSGYITSADVPSGVTVTVDNELSSSSTNPVQNTVITNALNTKQASLISGETIKTVNGESLIGSGDITITADGVVPTYTVRLQGVSTSKNVVNTYDTYNLISGVITDTNKRPTESSTTGCTSLSDVITLYSIDTSMGPDFVLDMAETTPYFYIVYYNVELFSLNTFYFKITSDNLFSSFTDYILGSTSEVYCVASGGDKDYYVWDGSTMTENPTTAQTIPFLSGPSIMTTSNTIYEIVGDIDLNGTVITPASGSVIKYGGGKIKNGTINGANIFYVDCPDIVFFENMRFTRMNSNQVWKDTWFTDIFEEGSVKGMSNLSLSRDYTIATESMRINADQTNRTNSPYNKLVLYGNSHTITLPAQVIKKYGSGVIHFINTNFIEVFDLNIEMANENDGRLQTVFDTNIGIFHNVKFKGACRFVAVYSHDVPTDIYTFFNMYPQLQFYDCELRTSKFIAESCYNIVIARNSSFYKMSSDIVNNEMFSISPFGYNDDYVNDSYIDFEGCYIEGGWETPNHGRRLLTSGGTYTYYYTTNNKGTSTYTNHITYRKANFRRCEMVLPFLGLETGFSANDTHSGTTDLAEFDDCLIYTGQTAGQWYADNLVFRRCHINVMSSNNTYCCPFTLYNPTGNLQFIDCVFDSVPYTSKSGRSWIAARNNGSVSAGDGTLTHYVLATPKNPGDDFKVVLKNNTFIESQYRNKIEIYCDAPTDGTLSDRVECSGNRYARSSNFRIMESNYQDTSHAPYSSCYGKITEGYWSTPSSVYILPIENSVFRGNETFSSYTFDACGHDFNFAVQSVYNTSVDTSYYLYDSLHSLLKKFSFE